MFVLRHFSQFDRACYGEVDQISASWLTPPNLWTIVTRKCMVSRYTDVLSAKTSNISSFKQLRFSGMKRGSVPLTEPVLFALFFRFSYKKTPQRITFGVGSRPGPGDLPDPPPSGRVFR